MKIYYKVCTIVLIFILIGCSKKATNLLVNGDAELPKFDSVPVGWTNIKGNWVSAQGDSTKHDFGFAQHGSRYFFAGNGLLCTLQQEVDVAGFADKINAQKQIFVLSGYTQTLDQGKISDQAMLKLECLDATKTKSLLAYHTDTMMSIGKWKPMMDTFLAPPNTRFIRVQLVAFRNVGGDNDGYFDNISLVAKPVYSYFLIILAIFAVVVVAIILIIYQKKKKLKNTA